MRKFCNDQNTSCFYLALADVKRKLVSSVPRWVKFRPGLKIVLTWIRHSILCSQIFASVLYIFVLPISKCADIVDVHLVPRPGLALPLALHLHKLVWADSLYWCRTPWSLSWCLHPWWGWCQRHWVQEQARCRRSSCQNLALQSKEIYFKERGEASASLISHCPSLGAVLISIGF